MCIIGLTLKSHCSNIAVSEARKWSLIMIGRDGCDVTHPGNCNWWAAALHSLWFRRLLLIVWSCMKDFIYTLMCALRTVRAHELCLCTAALLLNLGKISCTKIGLNYTCNNAAPFNNFYTNEFCIFVQQTLIMNWNL